MLSFKIRKNSPLSMHQIAPLRAKNWKSSLPWEGDTPSPARSLCSLARARTCGRIGRPSHENLTHNLHLCLNHVVHKLHVYVICCQVEICFFKLCMPHVHEVSSIVKISISGLLLIVFFFSSWKCKKKKIPNMGGGHPAPSIRSLRLGRFAP